MPFNTRAHFNRSYFKHPFLQKHRAMVHPRARMSNDVLWRMTPITGIAITTEFTRLQAVIRARSANARFKAAAQAAAVVLPTAALDASKQRWKDMLNSLFTKTYHHDIDAARDLWSAVTSIFAHEATVIDISIAENETLTVVGDVHGQFEDMMHHIIPDINKSEITGNKYLFLGDYVDRGPDGVEVLATLFLLKLLHPSKVFLLRGNHEDPMVGNMYGFSSEVASKYGGDDSETWKTITAVFSHLPIFAHVTAANGKSFCAMHGGLSSALTEMGLSGAKTIKRHLVKQIDIKHVDLPDKHHDVIAGALWSDPCEYGGSTSCYYQSQRGAGWNYNAAASHEFCTSNGLEFIVRAHQTQMDGYSWTHSDKVMTLFSAPNYCGVSRNKGAVAHFDHNLAPTFHQYDEVSGKTVCAPRVSCWW